MLVYRLYRTLVFVVLLLGVMDVLLVLYGWVAHGSLDMTLMCRCCCFLVR